MQKIFVKLLNDYKMGSLVKKSVWIVIFGYFYLEYFMAQNFL